MNDIPRRRARRSLLFVALLLVAAPALRAQTAEQFASAQPRLITANTTTAKPLRLKRIAPLKVSETPEGTRVTVASDAPLDDYAARREGDRFVVTLPHAELAQGPSELQGGGFERARAERHGDGLRLSFRLRDGVEASFAQSFNRLDIFFKTRRQQPASAVGGNVPADASAPAVSKDNATAKKSSDDSKTEASKAPTEGGLTAAEREAMRAMLRRVEELEARVKELEAERAKAVAASAATSTTSVASHTASAGASPTAVDESAAVPAPVNDVAGAGAGGHGSQDAHGQHEEAAPAGPPR
ncbi:MAG TPA: AMIN domain-containing protein, partial [Pyrinomonadaceae bacterium]